MYLKVADLAHGDPKKQKRRKWFDMSESIACPQDISIGMNPVGLTLKSALYSMTLQG